MCKINMIKTFLFGSKPIKLMKFKLIKLKLTPIEFSNHKVYHVDLNYFLTRFLYYSLLKLTNHHTLLLKIKSCTNFQVVRHVTRNFKSSSNTLLQSLKIQPFNPPLRDQKQASPFIKSLLSSSSTSFFLQFQPGIQTCTLTTSPRKPDKSFSSKSILRKNQYSEGGWL